MATYDNLPVYKDSYDLLIKTFNMVKGFTKDYKYTLGDVIKKEIIAVITSIYRANLTEDKFLYLKAGRESIEILRLYIRLCKDLHIINTKAFADTNIIIEKISKQLSSRQKRCQAKI